MHYFSLITQIFYLHIYKQQVINPWQTHSVSNKTLHIYVIRNKAGAAIPNGLTKKSFPENKNITYLARELSASDK